MKNNFIFFLLFTLIHQQVYGKRGYQKHICSPSSCGKISNIRYPFRLKDDPQHCGDTSYELACENNMTTLYLYSGQYHVQSINYDNFTIRVVDPGLQHNNCSSIPSNFLFRSDFCDTYKNCREPYRATGYERDDVLLFDHIVYLNCSHKVSNKPKYVDTFPCIPESKGSYIYAIAGDLLAEDFEVDCHVKLVAPTSSWDVMQLPSYRNKKRNDQILSYAAMHTALVYGFEISWFHFACKDHCGDPSCYFNTTTQNLKCHNDCSAFWGDYSYQYCGIWWSQMSFYAKDTIIAIWIGLTEIIKGPNKNYDGFTEYKVLCSKSHIGGLAFLASFFCIINKGLRRSY